MKHTYLLDVIQVLHPKEQQEFLVFLESPFFNRGAQNKEIIQLYQVILSAMPDLSEEKLEKSRVYALVFPDKPMIEGKLEKLMTELNRLLRTFAIVSRMNSEENEGRLQLHWIGWLRERGLEGRFNQALAKYKNTIAIQKQESLAQYRELFEIAEEEHIWVGNHNLIKGDLKIPELLHHLDLFYLNYKSDLNIRYLIQQKLVKFPVSNNNESFDAHITLQSHYTSSSSLLDLTHEFYQLLKKDNFNVLDFQRMVETLRDRQNKFSFDTLSFYYSHLRNYGTFLIDDGHTELVPTLHNLNKINLEDGYFFIGNQLRFNAYLSIVQIALRAGEIDWAMDFTEKYKARIIGGDDAQLYYGINKASCLLAAGSFDEALSHLPDTAPSSFYLLLVRRIELKAYYELKSDLLSYKMDAFRKFIERTAPKSVSANLQTMNLNFVHILTQLSQSPMKAPKRSAQLTARIQGKKLICERSWLLEKAQELG